MVRYTQEGADGVAEGHERVEGRPGEDHGRGDDQDDIQEGHDGEHRAVDAHGALVFRALRDEDYCIISRVGLLVRGKGVRDIIGGKGDSGLHYLNGNGDKQRRSSYYRPKRRYVG